jgi:uncharacterized membrane protein
VEEKYRVGSLILAGIGLVDSLYLTYVKLTNSYAICGPIGDCESVNSSSYAEIAGIPIALLGAGAYLVIILLVLTEQRGEFWEEYAPIFVFGLSFAGVLYSAYLTYLEIFVLRAICPYCVVSAIVLVLLLVLSSARLFLGFGTQGATS